MANPMVRIVVNANSKILRTVNIATTNTNKTFKAYDQTAVDSKLQPTWQDSGGAYAGLPTIYISGYSGPL